MVVTSLKLKRQISDPPYGTATSAVQALTVFFKIYDAAYGQLPGAACHKPEFPVLPVQDQLENRTSTSPCGSLWMPKMDAVMI
jgi:hypothetical protein